MSYSIYTAGETRDWPLVSEQRSGLHLMDQEELARRLLRLQEESGYDIVQRHGQRIFGGPPPGWGEGRAPPGQGTEVYCYRVPRDCFEDELVPVFSLAGRIYELRLMIEFSGTNRSYCYVRYTNEREAREAVARLNNYQVRPGCYLAVTRSYDNKKLSLRLVPALEPQLAREAGLVEELSCSVEGVARVTFTSVRGDWMEVEFLTHRLAALARRQLVPGNVQVFESTVRQVDWVDPVPGREYGGCSRREGGRTLDWGDLGRGRGPSGKDMTINRLADMFGDLRTSRRVPGVQQVSPDLQGGRDPVGWGESVPGRITAKTQLVRVCLSLGWSLPVYHLTGHTRDQFSSRPNFRCSVTVPECAGPPISGSWRFSVEEAELSAANIALAWVTRQTSPPSLNTRESEVASVRGGQATRSREGRMGGMTRLVSDVGGISGGNDTNTHLNSPLRSCISDPLSSFADQNFLAMPINTSVLHHDRGQQESIQ